MSAWVDLYNCEKEPCTHCGEMLWPPEVLYWVQVSKPVQVNGVWKALFIPGEDKPLCDALCSFEHEEEKRSCK